MYSFTRRAAAAGSAARRRTVPLGAAAALRPHSTTRREDVDVSVSVSWIAG